MVVSQQHAQARSSVIGARQRQLDGERRALPGGRREIVIVPSSSLTRSSMPRSPSPSRAAPDRGRRRRRRPRRRRWPSPPAHARSDACALRVPDAVGHRFLDDAVDAGAVACPAARRGRRRSCSSTSTRVAAHEVADVPFERRLQAEVVEHARPQAEREVADGAEHLVDELLALGDRRPSRASALDALDPAQLHAQAGEHLRDVVVQLARQVLALFLLRVRPAAATARASASLRHAARERRSRTRSRNTTISATPRPSSTRLPQQPVQVAAERRVPRATSARCVGEVGVVQLLDLLRDRQHRLAPRHHFPAQEAGAARRSSRVGVQSNSGSNVCQ